MNLYRYEKNLDTYYVPNGFIVYMTTVTIYTAITNLVKS